MMRKLQLLQLVHSLAGFDTSAACTNMSITNLEEGVNIIHTGKGGERKGYAWE
jgi:hypothetical protein